jgi:pimeloyl-ACP methyl ester carboxylesterase
LSSSAVSDAPIRDIVAQATDISFLITTLFTSSTRPTPIAHAVAATKKVAVIGHSDGAVTAAGVAYNSDYADPRIGAAVILSGGAFDFPGSWFSGAAPALLAIHGDDDQVNPYASSSSLYDEATGSKLLVTVLGGSHLGPFTTDPERSAIDALIDDFLRANLSGDRAAVDRLTADANITGELALADSA